MDARIASLFVVFLLLLGGCEDIPDETEDKIIHRVSLELEQISPEPLYPGAILDYNYTLVNIGREDLFDVSLETKLRKKSTGEIVKTQAELLEMELVVFKEGGMPLPKDIKKGEYELSMVASWDDGTDAASFKFKVDVEEIETKEEAEEKTESVNSKLEQSVQQEEEKDEDMKLVQEGAEKEEEEASTESETIVHVLIQDYRYQPSELNITVGTTVEWYNNDSVPHSASGAGFDSGPIAQGTIFRHKFTKPVIKIYSSTFTEGPYGTIRITE